MKRLALSSNLILTDSKLLSLISRYCLDNQIFVDILSYENVDAEFIDVLMENKIYYNNIIDIKEYIRVKEQMHGYGSDNLFGDGQTCCDAMGVEMVWESKVYKELVVHVPTIYNDNEGIEMFEKMFQIDLSSFKGVEVTGGLNDEDTKKDEPRNLSLAENSIDSNPFEGTKLKYEEILKKY